MKTKILLVAVLFSSLAQNAMAQNLFCTGSVQVDNVGRISTEPAKLEFIGPTTAIYEGPHASIFLGTKVTLMFTPQPNGSFAANLSTAGHGGELNFFKVDKIGEGDIQFTYRGAYGYVASGPLTCKK